MNLKPFRDIALQLGGTITECSEIDIGKILNDEPPKDSYVSRAFTPSSMVYECAVQRKFRITEQNWTRKETYSRTANYGTSIHEKFQKDIFPLFPGHIIRQYNCKNCGYKGSTKPWEGPCPICDNDAELVEVEEEYKLIYKGLDPDNENFHIRGYADGIWVMPNGNWRIIEIKTISDDVFHSYYTRKSDKGEGLREMVPQESRLPRPKDVEQAMIYAFMASEDPELDLDIEKCLGVLMIYINRGHPDPEKGFYMPYDAARVRYHLERIKTIKSVEQPLHLTKKCSNRNATDAKVCPWRDSCFPPKKRAKKKK